MNINIAVKEFISFTAIKGLYSNYETKFINSNWSNNHINCNN